LMQRRGRGFFTDGDIEEIWCDTEHEETQSARCQRASSRKWSPAWHGDAI
jgi:hypothetical protein